MNDAGCDAKKNSLDADQASVNRLPRRRIQASTHAVDGREAGQLLRAKQHQIACIMP